MKFVDENVIEVYDDLVIIPMLPNADRRLHYNRMRAVCLPDGTIYIQRLDFDPFDDEEDEYVWRGIGDVLDDAMYNEIRKAVQNYVRNQ